MKEARIALDGLQLAGLSNEHADGVPLLALHGWLDNAASFQPLAEHLTDRRLLALDMLGHGHSDHLPAGPFLRYNFVDAVPIVLAAADALGFAQFDLLGHSMGAGIASLVAAAAPDRVRRLALIEGLGPLADEPAHTLERFRGACQRDAQPSRLRVFPDVARAVEARHRASGLPREHAWPIVERGLAPVDGGYSWRSDPRLIEPTPVRMDEAQVHRLLAGITCPSWLLLAEPATPYLPTGPMQARIAQLADCRVEHLAGHHHLHLEHPAEVARRVRAFLGA